MFRYIVYGRKPRADEVPVTLPKEEEEAEKENTESVKDEKALSFSGMIKSSLVMCKESLRMTLRNRLGLYI